MVSPLVALTPNVQSAIATALGDDFREADPVLRPSQFADVQVNAALALAKRVGMPPREVAGKIVGALELDGVCDKVEVSGPGFINLTFSDAWLASLLQDVEADERTGVPLEQAQNIPIDYSAPNVAKEMHVGHLRTTVVGDSIARTLEHLGHHIIRQNHIGDWGTPFGMLIEHLLDVGESSDEAGLLVTDPNAFYQAARVKFDTAEKAEPAGSAGDFNVRARSRVVLLQAGDAETLRLWNELVDLSKVYFNKLYSTLGVTLTDLHLAGESMYNAALPGICRELEASGIAEVSEGALCVFLDGYTGREGKPVPLIIRKSDGGYGYATTDLATIKYRVHDLDAHRVLYVIGAPQSLHLNMVWDTARKAGWLPDDVVPVHVQIGNVLGDDRKILKTRSGKPLRLMALLEEAVDKARTVIDETRPDLDDPLRATMRSRSKTYSLSCATDRSAYFTAPMPIWRAIVARTVSSRSGRVPSMTVRAFSAASSSRAMRRSGLPERVLRILRSSPSTLPIWTWTGTTSSGSQPALRAVSHTMLRCRACGAPMT